VHCLSKPTEDEGWHSHINFICKHSVHKQCSSVLLGAHEISHSVPYLHNNNIRVVSLGEGLLLLADVKHSQKLTATPLHPMITAEWKRYLHTLHLHGWFGRSMFHTGTAMYHVLPDDF